MLTKFTENMDIVSALDNEPNDVGGLSPDELKGTFDKGGKTVQNYINDTLLSELTASTAAENLGAKSQQGENSTVQQQIDALHRASTDAGNVPAGGSSGYVLSKKSDDDFDTEWKSTEHTHPELSVLKGETPPTTEKLGVEGQFYLDTTTKFLYQCTTVENDTYNWKAVNETKVGTIITSARNDLSEDYALCNGAVIDESAYPNIVPFLNEGGATFTAHQVHTSTVTSLVSGMEKYANYYIIYGLNNSKPYILYSKTFDSTDWTYKVVTDDSWSTIFNLSYVNNKFILQGSLNGSYTSLYCDTLDGIWSKFLVSGSPASAISSPTKVHYINGEYVFIVKYYESYATRYHIFVIHGATAGGTFTSYAIISNFTGYTVTAAKDFEVINNNIYIPISTDRLLLYHTTAPFAYTSWAYSVIDNDINAPCTAFQKFNETYCFAASSKHKVYYSSDLITWHYKMYDMDGRTIEKIFYNKNKFSFAAWCHSGKNVQVMSCCTLGDAWSSVCEVKTIGFNTDYTNPKTIMYDVGKDLMLCAERASGGYVHAMFASAQLIGYCLPYMNLDSAFAYIKLK